MRRSEREDYNDALIQHLVSQLAPGAQFQRVRRDPPDYIVDAAVGRIGLELTEVQPERVADGTDAKRGNTTIHQTSVRRQILEAAEARYAGPPAHVRPSWDPWTRLSDPDIPKLAKALADAVAARTGREPAGSVMLGWDDLAATPLSGRINRVQIDWGDRIPDSMWASAFPLFEVTAEAIQRTIDEKDADHARWSEQAAHRWLLLTLSPESERLLDGAAEHTYTAAFDAVHCCDARLRFVPLSVQPRG